MNLQITGSSLSFEGRTNINFRKAKRSSALNLNQTILLNKVRHFSTLSVPLLPLLFQVINLPTNLVHAEDFRALETQGSDKRCVWVLKPSVVFFPNYLAGGDEVEAEERVLLLIRLCDVFESCNVEGDGLAIDWQDNSFRFAIDNNLFIVGIKDEKNTLVVNNCLPLSQQQLEGVELPFDKTQTF